MWQEDYVCVMMNQAIPAQKSKRLREKEAEILFKNSGPYVHVYTRAIESDIIFKDKEERYVAITYMAMAAADANVEVIAYAMMSNHFHFIIRGTRAQSYFDAFIRRLTTYLSRHGRPGVLKGMMAGYTEITSLKQFRDELAYVIRNPFVVREDIHLFAYPWTSGFLYFNPFLRILPATPVDNMSIQQKRMITKSKDCNLPKGLTLLGSFVNPASFVNYKLAEALFVTARQFTLWTMKNVEAQVETALRLGEVPTFPDEELLPIVFRLCREEFGQQKISDLDSQQLTSLAKRLKYDYHASNKQLARLLNMTSDKVDAMFPLSAKNP